jgi:hypothetical protein
MVPFASFRRSARTVILVVLLTTPFLLGTPPSVPCDQIVVTGRVFDASGVSIPGVGLSLEIKSGYDTLFSAEQYFGTSIGDCPALFDDPIVIDTTDEEEIYLLKGELEIYDQLDDSLRLVVRLANDSIVYGEPFAVRDSTSATPIYRESSGNPMSGSGCSCSSQPYIAGYTFWFEGRDVVVP